MVHHARDTAKDVSAMVKHISLEKQWKSNAVEWKTHSV